MEKISHTTIAKNTADRIAFVILLAALWIVPFFFIPSVYIPSQFGKVFFVYIIVIATFTAWIFGRLREGKIGYIKSSFFAISIFIPLWFGLSTLFSGSRGMSFMGYGFEVGTFSFILILFVLMYLVSELFTSVRAHIYAYLAFFGSFIIIGLFHLIRLIWGPDVLSFGILTQTTSALVGGWGDTGIFFGGVALFTFLSIELLKFEHWFRWLLYVVLIASLFLLSVVASPFVWYIVAITAAIFFVYRFTFSVSASRSGGSSASLPLVSLTVLIISIIFILANGTAYGWLSSQFPGLGFLNRFSIPNVEVRLSTNGTALAALQTIKHDPLFGAGPNRFLNEWLLAKPAMGKPGDLYNQLSSVDFNYGVGLIPTFFGYDRHYWISCLGGFLYYLSQARFPVALHSSGRFT
jgi:hypothetical protein